MLKYLTKYLTVVLFRAAAGKLGPSVRIVRKLERSLIVSSELASIASAKAPEDLTAKATTHAGTSGMHTSTTASRREHRRGGMSRPKANAANNAQFSYVAVATPPPKRGQLGPVSPRTHFVFNCCFDFFTAYKLPNCLRKA